jgi:hypothetical protein
VGTKADSSLILEDASRNWPCFVVFVSKFTYLRYSGMAFSCNTPVFLALLPLLDLARRLLSEVLSGGRDLPFCAVGENLLNLDPAVTDECGENPYPRVVCYYFSWKKPGISSSWKWIRQSL